MFTNEQEQYLSKVLNDIDNLMQQFDEDSTQWEELNGIWCRVDNLLNGRAE